MQHILDVPYPVPMSIVFGILPCMCFLYTAFLICIRHLQFKFRNGTKHKMYLGIARLSSFFQAAVIFFLMRIRCAVYSGATFDVSI